MKIGIIGSGFVGATAAYAMVMRGVGREIVLVDKNASRAQAEADDILHAVPFAHPLQVRAGDYPDLSGCRVVVITAGTAQKPGETRMDLLARNAAIVSEVVPSVLRHAPEAVLLMVTNPVDVMTHVAAKAAEPFGVASTRVLGSGTTLDTARFRSLLGRHLGVDPQHVHAYVVGEHGDSEVLTWSIAAVGGMPVGQFCCKQIPCRECEEKAKVDEAVRRAAYRIIEGKGATYYGIGSALARICEVILRDQRSILTVCTPTTKVAGVENVTVSLPHLVGGDGVLDAFAMALDEEETALLKRSAQIVREAIQSLGA
ncbi:MAG: L-lactate dehydrogenase [Anaerolineales bacterium]|nr:L-lactate dehydrogenase [Anaerolineales bacterium]